MIVDGNTYCRVITPILPPEYQEVEYIKNSGTQYINTNYIPNFENGFEISVEYIPENSSSRGCLLSNYCATPYYISLEVRDSFRQRFYYHNGAWDNSISGVKILNERNIGLFKYIDGVFYHTLNGTTQSYNYISPGLCNEPLLMFVDTNKRFATFTNYLKIYKCSIKDNNTLVRNFIPCYRKSDNEIGMYDTVNKVFYTNQGTGTFLKGNNVVHTIRYKIPTEERPYISGHVTDGSSTITFRVNNNAYITVPVDNNGNWKWVQDRDITSLANFVLSNTNIDVITIAADLSKCTTFKIGIALTTALKELIIKSSNSLIENMGYFAQDAIIEQFIAPKLSFAEITTDMTYIFTNCQKLKVCDLSSASISNPAYAFRNCFDLEYINFKAIKSSMALYWSSKLTKQSVLNIINAAEANVTYTLHSTVYNKCASGGDWYTDIQAAIDAKALEGYTVTLISA